MSRQGSASETMHAMRTPNQRRTPTAGDPAQFRLRHAYVMLQAVRCADHMPYTEPRAQDLHRQQQLASTMESIDMQELEQELTKTRGLFKQWADVTTNVAQETRSTHLTRLAAAKRG